MAGQRQRQARLASLLADLGRRVAPTRPPAPRLDGIPPLAAERTLALYREVGGTAAREDVLRPGAWDLVLADGLHVELDEEQHFNRYRALTLEPDWAAVLPWAPDYGRYAREREPACLRKARGGGYWSSASTEAMFGPADPPGVFARGGAPRWKQRALYDAMRDAVAASGAIRLTRVAVWDDLGGATLGSVLDGRAPADLEALAELLEERAT